MSHDAYAHIREEGAPEGPLLFLFHGTGGNERQFLRLGRELVPSATLVAPRGDVSEGGAARFFRRKAEGVYDMADLARATAKMGGFVAAHAADQPGARVLGLGYSNGANILASLVIDRRDRFDAAVLMHPLIGWEPEPGPVRTSVLVTAGRRDPICPPALTEQLAGWLAAQGAPVEIAWDDGGHEISRAELDAVARFLSGERVAPARARH